MRRFRSCRGVESQTIKRQADLGLLKAIPFYSSDLTLSFATALLDGLARRGGWLIFFGHGIIRDPGPFDATPALLQQVLAEIGKRGFPIVTVDRALDLISAPHCVEA